MNETRTLSMLQRVPVILAVTALSYGLSLEPGPTRQSRSKDCQRHRRGKAGAENKALALAPH